MKGQVKKCWQAAKHLFADYADHSTIHGVSYIGEKGRSWTEKLWWITVCCGSVLCCAKLIWDAWLISPIIIGFTAKPTPIWQIPFPSIMICPSTIARIDPINLTDITRRQYIGERYFENFTDQKKMQTVAKSAFCATDARLDEIKGYDNCNNCYGILQEMRIPLDEMFAECRFGNRKINCTDSFEEVILENHVCFNFNGLPVFRHQNAKHGGANNWNIDGGYQPTAPMNTYPRRTLSAGQHFGLFVLLRNRRRDVDPSCSFDSSYHVEYRMPYDSSLFGGSRRMNRMEDSMLLMLTPKLMTTAIEIHDYPVEKRKCYFSDEYRLKYYTQYTLSNCEAECVTISIIQQCQCVPFYLERQNGQNYCGPAKDDCMLEAKNELNNRNFEGCNCLPACSSISFESEALMARMNTTAMFNTGIRDQNEYEYSELTIFFKENEYMAAQRSERNGFTMFLANCGGLLGLFLGVSVISLLEIVFFCTIRLYFNQQKNGISDRGPTKIVKILQKKHYFKVTKELMVNYSSRTTIQGIKYVTESRLSKGERVWWLIVVIFSTFCCGSLISNTLTQYDQSPVIISYANEETPINEIPFPAVTICPQFVYRDFDAMYDYFKVRNRSLYYLSLFAINMVTAMTQVCDPDLFTDIDPENMTHCQNCKDFLNYAVGDIGSTFLACDYEKHFSQCSEVFSKVLTEEGVCFEYNTLPLYRNFEEPTDDGAANDTWTLEGGYLNKTRQSDAYPRMASKYSLRLSLLADRLYDDALCRDSVQGFKVYLHLPNEAPQVSKHFYLAAYSHFSLFQINPRVTITDPELRHLSIEKRQCYFSDERYLRFFRYYTQNNCEIECVVNKTLSECGCLLFTMPAIPDVKYCGISQIKCRQRVIRKNFNQNQASLCHCLSTCTSISYEIEANNVFMTDHVLWYAYTSYVKTNRIAAVDMVFRLNQFVAMKRSQLFGKTELIANVGGLLGLFLGFSFMSLLELVYFCTIRLFYSLRM